MLSMAVALKALIDFKTLHLSASVIWYVVLLSVFTTRICSCAGGSPAWFSFIFLLTFQITTDEILMLTFHLHVCSLWDELYAEPDFFPKGLIKLFKIKKKPEFKNHITKTYLLVYIFSAVVSPVKPTILTEFLSPPACFYHMADLNSVVLSLIKYQWDTLLPPLKF